VHKPTGIGLDESHPITKDFFSDFLRKSRARRTERRAESAAHSANVDDGLRFADPPYGLIIRANLANK